MAWNDPGRGRDDDPWGGRGRGDAGPPDLDEAFRKLQQQLSGIFGGKDSGGGGKGTSGGGKATLLLAAGVLLIGYGALGFYQLDQGERGVVLRFGAVQDEVVMPGLRWNPPLVDQVRKVNVTRIRSIDHQAQMLTQDENIVDIRLTVQWAVADPMAFELNVRDPELSLEHATESAVRHVAGSSTMDNVITEGRAAIAIEIQDRLQSYLDRYGTGIRVSKVNIDSSGPPMQVKAAFDDVQKAKEDEQKYVNEATSYAEGVVPEARGEASRTLEAANAYREQVIARARGEADRFKALLEQYEAAPEVTRQRLYLESMEQVLGSTGKVLVDVEDGNNMMYLPLDKIAVSAAGNASPTIGNDELVRRTAEEVIRQIESRQPGVRRSAR